MSQQSSPASPINADLSALDIDAAIDPPLQEAVAALDGRAPLLAGMARYHLGMVGRDLAPSAPGTVDRGKRFRPAVALLAAGAAGGDPNRAAPLGAAIELLHNFTLVHDDIQDESPARRHRATVWSIWGVGQAINAGDALFAVAHLPFFRLAGADPAMVLRLLEAFDRMTIAIVEGQTLDLGFEARPDVTSAEYLEMIAGKTSAIVRYAAWAGALLGGASEPAAERWAEFGLALGLGFQIQDDLLGIWGASEDTGKAPADDIRRRKQSLPILLLRERLGPAERAELNRIYDVESVEGAGVARVLDLLETTKVRGAVEREVARYHDQAAEALNEAAGGGQNPYRDALHDRVASLSHRVG